MREAFALLLQCKSFSHFFNKKYWQISDINVLNFNDMLTNDVVSFEQPGPGVIAEWLELLCYGKEKLQKVVRLNLGFAIQQQANSLCQPSRK